jgi:nitroreductase
MTRNFRAAALDPALIENLVDLASRAPSAGKTQGWHLVGLLGDDTETYWSAAMDPHVRETFAFPGLFNASFVGVVLADPSAYVERYGEPDKEHTGLGRGVQEWDTPYWTVDASMATMTFLHAVQDAGLGALFFAVAHVGRVRSVLGIPDAMQVIGAVAVGVPDGAERPGRSAGRNRRPAGDIIRWGCW